jgi:NAD(P)H-hydrate epimerase
MFGRAVILGGSLGMSGAVSLAGMACLRSGAGLVQLAVPEPCLPTVAGFEPSYMTAPLAADEFGRIAAAARDRIAELLAAATAAACGPGLGQSPDLLELVAWLYITFPRPLVLDADALNALAQQPEVLKRPGGPRVLTPHPGEFARLIAESLPASVEERKRTADHLAARSGAVVVLKGHATYITDGRQCASNATGNPGMATGGTGDVLTGIVTGLLCQGRAPFDAARLAAHVHGLAGDLAAAELGQVSLIASDLLDYLPEAFRTVSV